jgi:probable HAF family extracellular repeat protein
VKKIITLSILFLASTCFAQMYTVTEVGTPTTSEIYVTSVSNSGQVVGFYYGFITPNPADELVRSFLYSNGKMTDIQLMPPADAYAYGINDSGQVIGSFFSPTDYLHPFLFSNGLTTDLGTLGGQEAQAYGINAVGQITGFSGLSDGRAHAFLYDQGTMKDIGELGGGWSAGNAINDSAEITGSSVPAGSIFPARHAFLYSAGSIKDLGTLGGLSSDGHAINAFGQITGVSATGNGYEAHAFLYSNAKMQDLAGLEGNYTSGNGLDNWGQVVGISSGRAALYSNGKWHDLNDLIPTGSGCYLYNAVGITNTGQIAGWGFTPEDQHGFLLNPIYKAVVRPPINADGSSVFSAKRGVIPVKFTVRQYDTQPSCTLPATLSITRAGKRTLASVDESTYSNPAANRSNFRIDRNSCQYIYNLAASSLGRGVYRVDISINGIMVGHAVFALK